jgi:tRNA-guanine family transglycosylase
VLPVRNARHGKIYRDLNVEELEKCLKDPERPVDATKLYRVFDIRKSGNQNSQEVFAPNNPAILKPYTIGYVHHLLKAEPPSGYRLAVLQNIHFYVQLMKSIREIIQKS